MKLDIQTLLNSARATASTACQNAVDLVETATGSFGNSLGYAKQTIANSWLFGSQEVVNSEYDEKHYFLIPYRIAERGYTLYSMRCLPDGVPPINDLPKRRVFHLPGDHAVRMVETLLCDEASATVREQGDGSPAAARLADLADQIDDLDQKVFSGALLIGGLVALANPVAGGVLAAKALLPSVGMLLTKYGLRYAGDTLDDRSLQSQLKAAEKQVRAEFQGKSAQQIVEPLLAQLDKAINTEVFEYDPLVDSMNGGLEDSPAQARASRLLVAKAITNTYEETLASRKLANEAGLGPEDIRWLKVLRTECTISDQKPS